MSAEAMLLPRSGRLARIAGRLREQGVAATLRKFFGDRIFRTSTSLVIEFRQGWGEVGKNGIKPDWLTFAVIHDPAELPPLCDWMAHRRADFEAMLRDGKVGMLALQDGVVVGCAWIALSDHHDRPAREFYAVAPGEAYHYCWMIDPSVRRTNIGIPFCRFMIQALAEMGITRQFGVIDRVNRASYVIHMRFGYRECGVKVRHYVIFGSRWTRVSAYQGVLGTVTPPRRAR